MRSFWSRSRYRLRALGRWSWGDRALLAESVVMLAGARILVKSSSQSKLVRRMGGVGATSDMHDAPDASGLAAAGSSQAAARVGTMVERVAKVTWWRSMCLEKALAGKWMLRRRGISSTMYVGMARQGDEFVAHAWLVGEGRTLTGGGGKAYATLAAFHEPGQ